MSDQDEYPLGYANPPQEHRFAKGKSGNRRGRPKKREDEFTLLQRALKHKVKIKGVERKVPMRDALIYKLRELALTGDRRALKLQRSILNDAGYSDIEEESPEETREHILNMFRNLGVKVVDDTKEQ